MLFRIRSLQLFPNWSLHSSQCTKWEGREKFNSTDEIFPKFRPKTFSDIIFFPLRKQYDITLERSPLGHTICGYWIVEQNTNTTFYKNWKPHQGSGPGDRWYKKNIKLTSSSNFLDHSTIINDNLINWQKPGWSVCVYQLSFLVSEPLLGHLFWALLS